VAGVKKVREGPKVSIELECRGCNYLKIWAGMCDVHFECKKGAWRGINSRRHGSSIIPPDKCPFRRKAIKEFEQALKQKGGE